MQLWIRAFGTQTHLFNQLDSELGSGLGSNIRRFFFPPARMCRRKGSILSQWW